MSTFYTVPTMMLDDKQLERITARARRERSEALWQLLAKVFANHRGEAESDAAEPRLPAAPGRA